MERKRAWITAGVVAVTFTAAALAVMANTGLLAVSGSDRQIGRLTPADITVGSADASTGAPADTVEIVRYEDVYVTAPAAPVVVPPTSMVEPAPAEPDPVTDTAPQTASVTRPAAEDHSADDHSAEGHDQGGEDDDD